MPGMHSPSPPFPSSSSLSNTPQEHLGQDRSSTTPSHKDSDDLTNHVPREPSMVLTGFSVGDFSTSELNTPVLNEIHDHLWCVARESGKSINPINRQRVKVRQVIATEDASLHLVWHRDRIYVKPMPLCLLNHDFWTTFLSLPVTNTISNQPASTSPQQTPEHVFDRRIALGFLRSYALLVCHHVNFVLARDAHLFPA